MHDYTRLVAAHLRGLTPAQRRAALDDLDQLMADGVDPSELGDPAAYAAALRPEGPEPDPGVWAPQSPMFLVRRAFGWGWRVNAGAVAVRLGWLRPDDLDDDVAAAVPGRVRRLTRVVPAACAVVTATAAANAIRRGRPVAMNVDLAGRVTRTMDPRWLMVPTAVAAGAAAWGARGEGTQAVTRPALAASAAGTSALLAGLAARARADRALPWAGPLVVVAPVAIELAMTVLPIRAGVRHVAEARR
ncbi:hypothetical protein GCM10027418_22230 [Mariniluteicoccus endophyticus]